MRSRFAAPFVRLWRWVFDTFPFLRRFEQLARFCLVGVSNTLLSTVLFDLSYFLIGLLLPDAPAAWQVTLRLQASNLIAFFLSVTNAFLLSSRFVFRTEEGEKRNPLLAFGKTVASYAATGLLLTAALMALWDRLFAGGPEFLPYLYPLFNLPITVPINFILNKFWAFRAKKESKPTDACPHGEQETDEV